jgi:hypothetical protein
LLDCTHLPTHGRAVATAIAALAAAAALALVPAGARADGDPASDVLATQSVYLPQDAEATATQQAQLSATVVAARRAGYPIRIALIASKSDLGSVGGLWRQPVAYASFLGQELGLVFHGPLLVVMPNGFGLYRALPQGGGRQVTVSFRAPGTAARLVPSALTAIQVLARISGHHLSIPAATSTAGATAGGGLGTVAWIVFAAGLVVIVAAWTASLRVRPLRRRAAP